MSQNLDKNSFDGQADQTTNEKDAYIAAKEAQYKAEARPSKVSEWPLVGFVEKSGIRYPLYRAED